MCFILLSRVKLSKINACDLLDYLVDDDDDENFELGLGLYFFRLMVSTLLTYFTHQIQRILNPKLLPLPTHLFSTCA